MASIHRGIEKFAFQTSRRKFNANATEIIMSKPMGKWCTLLLKSIPECSTGSFNEQKFIKRILQAIFTISRSRLILKCIHLCLWRSTLCSIKIQIPKKVWRIQHTRCINPYQTTKIIWKVFFNFHVSNKCLWNEEQLNLNKHATQHTGPVQLIILLLYLTKISLISRPSLARMFNFILIFPFCTLLIFFVWIGCTLHNQMDAMCFSPMVS